MYGGGKLPSALLPPLNPKPLEISPLPRFAPLADEVSAIVIDVGSYSCKEGYAGDDTPKAVFLSVSGIAPLLLPEIPHSRSAGRL
jgi:hypothetical protein